MKKTTYLVMTGLTVALLAGCTQATKTESTKISSSTDVSSNKAEANNGSTDASKTKEKWTVEAAKAMELFAKEYPAATITSLDLESSFGEYYYEITGVDDTKEYGVKIQATTGEVKKEREESLEADEQNGVKKKADALDTKEIISIKKATEIAEKDAGQGTAKEWSLDKEIGVTYWDVKVVDGQKDYEIKLNAQTGEVLERDN